MTENGYGVIIVSASPNPDGLTAACAAAAAEGVALAGGRAEEIRLNNLDIGMCEACGNGWGTCLHEHRCQVEDDFQALHRRIEKADALILVTPVYWGEPSEAAKAFLDRLRRCEGTRSDAGALTRKPVLAVAAAGGSGGGMITCLLSLENWVWHIGARVFDLIPVNRWSRPYKLTAIREAARTLTEMGRAGCEPAH